MKIFFDTELTGDEAEVQPKPKLQFPDNFSYDNFFANKLSEVKVLPYTPLGEYKYEIAI